MRAHRGLLESLGFGAVCGAYLAYVFQLASGLPMRAGVGDWFDPYFINFLLEHWDQSLRHLGDPASPPMYFPAHGTLGYSHGLVLYVPFYAATRVFLDPFRAENAALFLFILTGSLCLFVFLRRYLRLRLFEALVLAAAFVTSPNLVGEATGQFIQRASIFFVPVVMCLGAAARERPTWMGAVLAWLAGFSALLMFTQDFYTGILSALVLILLLPGMPVLANEQLRRGRVNLLAAFSRAWARADVPASRASRWWIVTSGLLAAWAAFIAANPIARQTVAGVTISARRPAIPLILALIAGTWYVSRRWRPFARARAAARALAGTPAAVRLLETWHRSRWRMMAAAAGIGLGAAIFLAIYATPYREHRAFPVDQLIQQLRTVPWSIWAAPWRFVSASKAYVSLRPFVLALSLAVAAWMPACRLPRSGRRYALWLLTVAVVVFLLPYRFDDVSLWQTVFAPLPGLSAIRDPKRIIEPFELAMTVVAGLYLSRAVRSTFRVAVLASLAILIAVDWNTSVLRFARPIAAFRSAVEAPLDIHPSCRSFFIKPASAAYMSRSEHMQILYGMDSAFIALRHRIPTINGYSGWAPPGWPWGLANPQEPLYFPAVREWILARGLKDICILDIEARTMVPYRLPEDR